MFISISVFKISPDVYTGIEHRISSVSNQGRVSLWLREFVRALVNKSSFGPVRPVPKRDCAKLISRLMASLSARRVGVGVNMSEISVYPGTRHWQGSEIFIFLQEVIK